MEKKQNLTISDWFNLSGKIAVVTGGASGIGFATAKMLSETGAIPILFDINKKVLKQSTFEITKNGKTCVGLLVDVSNENSLSENFQTIVNDFGKIDILVNCAGITIRKPATELAINEWNSVVNVNMTGSFLSARCAAKIMCAQENGGTIINMASIMGFSGGGIYPNISYQTTKGAIVNMTRALAVEWAKQNIRVNAIAPTYVRTPLISSILAQPEIVEKIETLTPLGRIAEPEEIAAGVIFLASPGAAMITGHTLAIDGGFLAQ